MVCRQVCRNVRLLAKSQGYKMKDVERAAGLSVGYFNRCSKNRSSTSIDTVYALARLFDVPVDYLISDSCEKSIKAVLTKITLSDVVKLASEVLSKDEMRRVIREDLSNFMEDVE